MNLSRIILSRTIAAITFCALSGLAAAQTNVPVKSGERAEIRHDNRDIVRDRHDLGRDHRELRQARGAHDMKFVRAERHDIRHDRRDLHRDRMERRHDRRELHGK
ncbi:MAG TPA: hypothetical protein VFW00_01805 [Rhodocyclaceae bacterium]|nr:hypothetical protein [Rhodocyclaceae bacterium]